MERSSCALCYGTYLLSELDYELLEVSYSLFYSLKCLAQCFPHITDSHWSQCLRPNQITGERRNRRLGVLGSVFETLRRKRTWESSTHPWVLAFSWKLEREGQIFSNPV